MAVASLICRNCGFQLEEAEEELQWEQALEGHSVLVLRLHVLCQQQGDTACVVWVFQGPTSSVTSNPFQDSLCTTGGKVKVPEQCYAYFVIRGKILMRNAKCHGHLKKKIVVSCVSGKEHFCNSKMITGISESYIWVIILINFPFNFYSINYFN